MSEFSYTGKILPQLEVRGGYLFYRYSGPASLDMSMDGIARTNSGGTTDAPYSVSLSTRAHVTEPNQVVDQGFTYKVNEWWSTMFDYRYSHFTVDSDAQFRSVNGTTVATGDSQNQWRIAAHTLDLNMAFTPMASLLVRAGIRYLNTDIRMLEDGVIDTTRTKHIKTVWPIGSVYYQPTKMLTIRADVESSTNGTSYTRVTPHTDVGGRFVVRFRPTEKFYIEDSAIVRNRKLLDTDYHSTVRSNAVTANYDFNPKYLGFRRLQLRQLVRVRLRELPARHRALHQPDAARSDREPRLAGGLKARTHRAGWASTSPATMCAPPAWGKSPANHRFTAP